MTDLDGLRKFYAQTASFYEAQVVPVFGPLARSLAEWTARCVTAQRTYDLLDPFDLDEESSPAQNTSPSTTSPFTALDIGTGTALLARNLAALLGDRCRMVGVD